MNIGIDVGWTIKGVRREKDRDKIAPESFRVIKRLVQRNSGTVYLISKVDSYQKQRVEEWLKKTDFFNQTGVNEKNLYFCFERKDKGIFVKALDIKIMIDDRAEVMAALPLDVKKLLLVPEERELANQPALKNIRVVQNWSEIEQVLFP